MKKLLLGLLIVALLLAACGDDDEEEPTEAPKVQPTEAPAATAVPEPEEEEEVSQIDEDVLRIRKLLKMNVEELELSVRSHNCLKAADIHSIGDLVHRDEQEMLKFRNFGRKSLQELSKILEEKGLHFGMDVDAYLRGEAP